MESEHRKIELQSPSDLTYLTSQIRTAARQKLDLHLPPSPTPASPTNCGATSKNYINGIDVVARGRSGDEVDERGEKMEGILSENESESLVEKEEFEPFDDKLRASCRHRRTTPKAAADAFQERFERENGEMAKGADVLGVGMGDVAGVEAGARQEELERNWERAIEGLQRLNKGLPETRARLERAGDVVGYLGKK
ncbi:hypothetical protein HRS9139_03936 [Pyrenophora teres f. teres]|nr:hypothetical protein HRS9139_03936 [Pyrenophora teres f. teres]